MSQELMQTSAPQGLEPGSHGFCTIVCTSGMAANLAARLESLSAYRHLYQPHDPQAANNPVAFSHLVLTVGGRRVHVVSRVAAAGVDYTKRTNRFAHHVVLDGDVPLGGPAWLLSQPGVMKGAWSGPPQAPAAGPPVPRGDRAPAVCEAWKRLTGDAGWGGVLAEAAAANPAREVIVIFRPGMHLLPLLAESLALLPAASRWRVTFSTYFTGLPVDVPCLWRCVAEGSPEAAAARKARSGKVIDLCGRLGPPPATPYVTAARTGLPPARLLPESERTSRVSDQKVRDALGAVTAAAEVGAPLVVSDDAAFGPPVTGPVIALTPVAPKKKHLWMLYVAVSMIVLAVVVGLGLPLLFGDRSREADKALAAVGANEDVKPVKPKPEDTKTPEKPKPLPETKPETLPSETDFARLERERKEREERERQEKERQEREKKPPEKEEPKQTALVKQLFGQLPATAEINVAAVPGGSARVLFGKGKWSALRELKLAVATAAGAGVVEVAAPTAQTPGVWVCKRQPLHAGVATAEEFGSFLAADDGLWFEWKAAPGDLLRALMANAVLSIEVPGVASRKIALRNPLVKPGPLRLGPKFFNPTAGSPRSDTEVAVKHLPRDVELHLDVWDAAKHEGGPERLSVGGRISDGPSAAMKRLTLPLDPPQGAKDRPALQLLATALPYPLASPTGIRLSLEHVKFQDAGQLGQIEASAKNLSDCCRWTARPFPKKDDELILTRMALTPWINNVKTLEKGLTDLGEQPDTPLKQELRKKHKNWEKARGRARDDLQWLRNIELKCDHYADQLQLEYRVFFVVAGAEVTLVCSSAAGPKPEAASDESAKDAPQPGGEER